MLEALRALGVGSEAGPIVVVSDSTYVINCFRDRWWVKWQRNGWTQLEDANRSPTPTSGSRWSSWSTPDR